jgi:DNA-binding transcriptional ArsR family regulator
MCLHRQAYEAAHLRFSRQSRKSVSQTWEERDARLRGPRFWRGAIFAFTVSLGEPMTDLNSLALFAKVVEAGSFSEAARRLKMPISTVSRRIAELEDQLGVRLLERSTRNLRLKSCCAGPDSRSASGVSGRHFGEAGSSSATRRDYVKRAS